MSNNHALLVDRLKARRRALRLTQQDVADLAGVQRQTIGRLENGDPNVSVGTAMLIADALGLDLGSEGT